MEFELIELKRMQMQKSASKVHTRGPKVKGPKICPFTLKDRMKDLFGNDQLIRHLSRLHMVHERNEELVCGRIMPQGGLQAAEVRTMVMMVVVMMVMEMAMMLMAVSHFHQKKLQMLYLWETQNLQRKSFFPANTLTHFHPVLPIPNILHVSLR